MFKQLFKIFKSNTLLDKAYSRSFEMLDMTYEMFDRAKKSLRESADADSTINVSEMDHKVNKFERKVRRKVFRHLAITGADDLYSGLVLSSIIIDIERIGDYTKNIAELAANFPRKLNAHENEEDLVRIENAVADIFKRTRRCFEVGDDDDAKKLIQEHIWINRLCDKIALSYIKEGDKKMPSSEAVSLALYFRYLKRINSHLQNIATSIVNPFDRIGFLPKDLRDEIKLKRKKIE